MPTALPRTLDAWIKALDKQALPVDAERHRQICRALADSRRSLREIAELMQDCPSLALSVLREANRGQTSSAEPVESLESALSRLGLARTEALLEAQPSLAPGDIPQALRQLQLISQHAAQQANGLFAGRLARLWQEIHWGSLLFLAPLWSLLAAQPHLLQAWEQRVLVHNEPASKVEHELLGVPLLQLCLALAERWRLPAWVAQGYRLLTSERRQLVKALHIARDNEHPLHQQQLLDADSALRRWLTQPANCIVLANGLALSAHQAWSCPHSLRWQRLTGLYLKAPLSEVQQQVHRQAAQSARLHDAPGLWHPAEALLWPWQARHLQALAAPAATPKPAPQVQQWKQLCGQLLAQPSAFNNLAQLSVCACQALQACGMQRVLLLLADRNQNRLRVLQQVGLDSEALRLTLEPQHSQVLRRLLLEPGQLRLTPGNVAQFSALLPGALKALFGGEHLLLRSLASNGRVAMLVVADQKGAPFADTQLQAFGKTAQCIERALGSFARRGA